MPGAEFNALNKVAGGVKQGATRVGNWAKSSVWNTENDMGENPFSNIKSLPDLNTKYKEAYGELPEGDRNDPVDEATRKIKNDQNENVKLLNMYYQLQRFLISKNFIGLLKPLAEEFQFAAKDDDKDKIVALKRELTDVLKAFKINNYYNGHEEKPVSYLIDLVDYLNVAYTGVLKSSRTKYKALKNEFDGMSGEEKARVTDIVKNGFSFGDAVKAVTQAPGKAVKAGVEKFNEFKKKSHEPLPDEGAAEMDADKAEVEKKKPLDSFFKVDEKAGDTYMQPKKKTKTVKVKSVAKLKSK